MSKDNITSIDVAKKGGYEVKTIREKNNVST